MREEDREILKPFFPYIKLLLTALYKLPAVRGDVVYRGLKGDHSKDYPEGSTQMWWAFSSTTRSIEVLTSDLFLGDAGPRTMLHIQDCDGFDITPYSAMKQQEKEVLLAPGTEVEVHGVAP